ncbi:phiSA1p31-related protein [Streptomyces sp. M2CJ-2]|uniref:phiSA1p31-related protein n=1 Tax=Streptomyces sp. M2CJ-2 TaxID=2803948 RepID=UPI0019240072|nr:phiSA1p31-related protein [Streptomyces sp. M2CJ-2]MBL3664447.1 phiSA1p31-related protein [Streptomyces sp. M2CJ-2]
MSTYLHDGTVFDLGIAYADVTGIEWQWTGQHNQAGEPLMGSVPRGCSMPEGPLVSLPDLYAWHGPLIPTPRKATAAMYRQALEAA